MADLQDFGTAVGALIKGRATVADMAARMRWSSNYASDADALTTPGTYATNASTLNIPVAASGFIDQRQLGSSYQQVWSRYGTSGEQWWRYKGSTAWVAWQRIDAGLTAFVQASYLTINPADIPAAAAGMWPVPSSQTAFPFSGAGVLIQYPMHQTGTQRMQVAIPSSDVSQEWRRWGSTSWTAWTRTDAGTSKYVQASYLAVDPDNLPKTAIGVWPVPSSQAWASLPFTGNGTLAQYPIQQLSSAVYQSAIPSSDLTKEWRRYGGSGWGPWLPVHAEAPPIDAADAPSGSGFKLVPLALTLGPAYAGAVPTDGAARFPLRYAAPITRWRVHIEARDPRTGWVATTDSTINGVWVGTDDGTDSGKTTTAPTSVSGSAVIKAGEEWVSKWSDIPISGDMLLSIGYTASERGLVGGAWTSTTPADAFSTAGTWTKGARAPFSVWIEAETYATTPVVAVVGDSLSVGVGAALPINDSTLSQWARGFGALPVHYAQSGDTMANSESTAQWKWTRWQHLARPDACVMALGTNDLLTSGTSVAESQRLHGAVLANIRQFISGTVYDASVLPSTAFTGAPEDNRRAYNTWLGAQQDGARGVYWLGPAVSTDDETIPAALAPDGTHLTTAGYALLAAVLTDGAPLTAPAPLYA